MKNFFVFVQKEWKQFLRELKIIWFPVVFLFLGITQPVVSYYLPSILKALGGGQGITIDPSMTAQQGGQVLASTLGSQFDQLGVIIIIVSLMGIVQSDKANGMLSFILTRPVSITSYLSGKIISHYLFIACSVTIGYFISYAYVVFLFTSVPLMPLFLSLLYYLIWVLFIVSFTTMVSTIFNSQGMIALLSIVFLLGCRIIVGLNPIIDSLNPASMSSFATKLLITGNFEPITLWSLLSTIFWLLVTILMTNRWISKKKFHTD